MKKLFVLALVLLALSLSIMAVSAAPADSGALGMAQYFPADTTAYFAIRTDEAYLDELNQITLTTMSGAPLPSGMDMPLSLRDNLEMGLASAGLTLDDIYAWLGDYLAVGFTELPMATRADLAPEDPNGYILLLITDRDALIETVTTRVPEAVVREVGEYIALTPETEETQLFLGEEFALILPPDVEMPEFPLAESLLDSANYQAAAAALPADTYNFAAYLDLPVLFAEADMSDLEVFGATVENTFAPLIAGGIILDKYSLVLDIAQLPGADGGNAEVSRIDRDFVAHIPGNASAVIHATDFTGLFNALTAAIATVAPAGSDDPMAQLEAGLQAVGIDLQEDLLSWTTGDYALFLRTDIRAIAKNAADQQLDLNGNFDFGLLIEATDAAKAKTLATKIGTLAAFLSREDGISVEPTQFEGVDVTSITVNAPLMPGTNLTVQVVIGASDELFFIGTADAIGSVLRGEAGLDQAKAYQQAQAYFLPEPTSIWYTDGEGFIVGLAGGTIGTLTLMGPAIGNVFENIVDDLDAPEASNSLDVAPTTVQSSDEIQQALALLDYAIRVLGSTSITSTITPDGVVITRLVMSYNPQ